MLIDTHCHIHWPDYPIDSDEVINHAHKAGIMEMICVGTDETDSQIAVKFAQEHDSVFAAVGVHPHYAEKGIGGLEKIVSDVACLVDTAYSGNGHKKLVAIGEVGLDYYKNHSSHESQQKILREQIEIALKYDLPIIFHVREAYDDFWPIFDSYQGIRGVLHSFTDTMENAQKGIDRGLFIGVNGISTFTKDEAQKSMYADLPQSKTLLETDAPYLTPSPFRGKVQVNEPAFVKEIAEHYGATHQINFDEVAKVTTANARALFNL